MHEIARRLGALRHLARPMAFLSAGIVVSSIGLALVLIHLYRTLTLPPVFTVLTLQFLPIWLRGLLLLLIGAALLVAGVLRLSRVAVIPLDQVAERGRLVIGGYAGGNRPPRVAVLSGGAGMLIPASIGRLTERLTCVIPLQDSVEYYYRASSLFNFEHVVFVAPLAAPAPVQMTLDDGEVLDVQHDTSADARLAQRYVRDLHINADPAQLTVTRATLDALREADAIILGPGSLFESVLPNLMLPAVGEAIRASRARTIYICSLMTEPGMTTGFGVSEHIQQLIRFGGFTPDYVLVNARRIDAEVRQIYAEANQTPVFLSPEDYEETAVRGADRAMFKDVMLEGAVVVEADLASSVVQLTASLDNPDERRTVRVLRHDPEKLIAAVIELLKRG